MTENIKFYRNLISAMDKHSFTSYSFQTLNDLYIESIRDFKYLNLNNWQYLAADSIKLLNEPDFEFYREYIKIDVD